MGRFAYKNSEFGKYQVYNSDIDFSVIVGTDVHAILLCDLLNKQSKKIEYQERVINKCIRNDKKYTSMINDKDDEITQLKNEKRILKKIIVEQLENNGVIN